MSASRGPFVRSHPVDQPPVRVQLLVPPEPQGTLSYGRGLDRVTLAQHLVLLHCSWRRPAMSQSGPDPQTAPRITKPLDRQTGDDAPCLAEPPQSVSRRRAERARAQDGHRAALEIAAPPGG